MRHTATAWLALFVCLSGFAAAQTLAQNPDTLASQVLAALKSKDQQALETLAITPAEFKKYIWPTIAVDVSGGGQITADKFYVMYRKSSEVGLTQHLAQFGGRPNELVRINTESPKRYNKYRLLPNPEIIVRGEGGQEKTLRLGSALLEYDGSFKLASFYRAPERAKQ